MEPADFELLPELLLPAEFESEDVSASEDLEPSASSSYSIDVAIFLRSGYVTFLLSLILELLDLPYTETAMDQVQNFL